MTTETDGALVAALAIAAKDNTLALDHVVRLRREAHDFVTDAGGTSEDGYIVTAVVSLLAFAEEMRREQEVTS